MKYLNVLPFVFSFLLFPFMGKSQTLSDTTFARQYLDSAKVLIVESIQLFDSREYSRSYIKADSAYEAFNKALGNKSKEVALAFNQMGRCKYMVGEYEEAIEYFKKTLLINQEILGELHPDIAKMESNIGLTYHKIGKYDMALLYHQQALKIQELVLEKGHPDISSSINNIGRIYEAKGAYNKALEYYQKALEIQKNNPKENQKSIFIYYLNIGNIYQYLGDFDKALDFKFQSLRILESLPKEGRIPFILSQNYSSIGVSYYSKGDFYKAIEYNKMGVEILENEPEKDFLSLANYYMNIGNAYNQIGFFDKALEFQLKALGIWGSLKSENHPDYPAIYKNIGITYSFQKDYSQALAYKLKALEIEKINNDSLAIAKSYNNIGSSYGEIKEYDKALIYFEKACEIWKEKLGANHPYTINAYYNIGSTHRHKGNYDEALLNLKNALIASNYTKNNFKETNSLEYLMESLNEMSILYEMKFKETGNEQDIKDSYEFAQQSIAAIEYQSSTFNQGQSKILWKGKLFNVYENAQRIAYKLAEFEKNSLQNKAVFSYSERSKASFLQFQINELNALHFSGICDSLLEKEHDLRIKIAYHDKKLQEKTSLGLSETDSISLEITAKLFNLNREYEILKKQFEEDYPQYYKAKYDFSTVDFNYVQNELLDQDQSLLEFFVGDSSIFIFLVQKDHYEVHEVKHDFPLKDWVQEMTKEGIYGYYTVPSYERTRQLEEKTTVSYTNAAQKLYEKLIAPVADRLTENLIIIPDGILGYVPFEALLTEAPPKLRVFKAYPFLIKKHQISYCYSATLLKEMRQKQHREKPSDHLLAMAPFFMGDVSELVARIDTTDLVANITLRDSLLPLPNSGEEVATVNKLWNGISVFGTDASLSEFQQKAEKYRILHLSTHGKADDRVGDYAYLAFGVPDEKGTFDKLYARDLYNYSLNADMVVLSACETGIGKLQRGEGIISLARAFAYAGAKSIFTTLWQVSDENTKDIFVDFYKYLKAGKPKDEALRLAKLDYLEKHAGRGEGTHPFFWAGLIGIGDMSPLAD